METFGRGCLYVIVGLVAVGFFAFITQSTIHIPWFVFIPLVILAFWVAGKRSRKDD